MADNSGTQSLEEEEMENSQEEELEESVSWTEEIGSRGLSGSSEDTMILVSQKGRKRRRSFDIPNLSEDEMDEEVTKRQKIEEIRNWNDDDDAQEESVINLMSGSLEEGD